MKSNERRTFKDVLKAFVKKITVKNIFKLIAVLIIITVYTLLLGRMYLAKDRGVMNKYSPTDNYLANADSAPELLTQNLTYTMDEAGYYRVSNLVFIPEIGELQINVRYNNSTLDALSEHYEDVSYSGEPFTYELTDNNGNTYAPSAYIATSNLIYNFRKLVFDNVNFEAAERLYLDVKYVGDESDGSPMHVRFTVYNSEEASIPSDLKSSKTNKFISNTEG